MKKEGDRVKTLSDQESESVSSAFTVVTGLYVVLDLWFPMLQYKY
jgi:hypothetical protein